ncbi:MAG: transporter substrate-binding domain-containing protein [Hyphomicrobiales bacterium]|nr:transporter substrate-binding domain-containing protein [Hyphomicrobiales bacterium]
MLTAWAGPARAADVAPLRLCSDPTNLPFSSDDPKMPGIYNEFGADIAKALHRPVAYHYYKSYFGARTVRETMLSNKCDMMIGLPFVGEFMGNDVVVSQPFATESYAIVTKKGVTFTSYAAMKGKRIAVQFESTPQNVIAEHPDITAVTVLKPAEAMAALASGKVDAAFMWGPNASWLNRQTYANRFAIQPVSGFEMTWPVAIGFGQKSRPLMHAINKVLPGLKDAYRKLEVKYGLVLPKPVEMSQSATSSSLIVKVADKVVTPAPAPAPASAAAASAAPATPGPAVKLAGDPSTDPAVIARGRQIFDGTCSHCHGPDAVQSDWHIDLRLLNHRYGNDMFKVFWTTVHHGRPDKGMPNWTGVFTDKQFHEIYSFLHSIQRRKQTSG